MKPIYFMATNADVVQDCKPYYHHNLFAVNELMGDSRIALFEDLVRDPKRCILLDSGVYNLAMEHANHHGITHDEALSTPPDEMDGFNELYERYIWLVEKYKDFLWGYIEIDLGGRENKIKTRARLEERGLSPIPVYHPLSDGWDYFDYLAERYPRLCFGNIVRADSTTKLRLIATAWERHRKYPHLWIHLLGIGPNQWMNAFPVNSCDATTWLNPTKYGSVKVPCDGFTLSELDERYQTIIGIDPSSPASARNGIRIASYDTFMRMRVWQQHFQSLAASGFEEYP